MLKLYDTLQGEVVEFHPRKEGEVSIYACGPTVYDAPHLGHARTAITFDVIARYFEWLGNKVTLVANITDIDDKIIARAKEKGMTEPALAQKYLDIYNEQMTALGVRSPNRQPRATQYVADPSKSIKGMVSIIAELVDAGAAYVIEGSGVYFDISKYKDYGQLVHRTPQDLQESGQARIETNEKKRSPLDFALWKAAKPDEPEWESPWMPGRPGWHIECVAMSLGELGEDFDIHGGGSDLIFPHHENERAEACATGQKFARYWVHSGMVNINGEKMAKSENNFINLDAQLKTCEAATFRLAILQTHYRSILELTDDSIAAATAGVQRICEFIRKASTLPSAEANPNDMDSFKTAMNNDFATPTAIALIFDLVRDANTALDNDDTQKAATCLAGIREMDTALGLGFDSVGSESGDADEDGDGAAGIQKLEAEREEARESGDYQKSDELRDELLDLGIKVQDHPDKPTEYIKL